MNDEDGIIVLVEVVTSGGSLGYGEGTDIETGDSILFAGDWRPMRDLGEAIESEGPQEAYVPNWAIQRRVAA